jgi:ferric-dicitrate binding protein FerR (iron transport regulator)
MREEIDYRDLIIKFLAVEISDSEIDILKSWLEKDPDNRRIFDEENELWQESGLQSEPEYFKTEEGWRSLSSSLNFGEARKGSVVLINKNKLRVLLAAASFAVIIALGGLMVWLVQKQPLKQQHIASSTVFAGEGQKAKICLPDSTIVILNSGSSLQYGMDYNLKDRVVNLIGEGFFVVHTDPERPLKVQSGDITVIAAGTRFNMLSYSNENRIETTLEAGKINVTIKGKDTINLSVGEQVVYFQKSNEFVVRKVATETYTSWKENKLRLIDTPFEEALNKIARRYNVTFEIHGNELLDLRYTATFIDESIIDVMQMLKVVSPITYKIDYRTSVRDKEYKKPRIIIMKRNI